MAKGYLHLSGGPELQAALRELDEKVAKRIARAALKAGAMPMLHAARSKAPIDTGLTVESLKIATGNRKGKLSARVQTKSGDYKGKTFYASFVEYGHYQGSRKLGNARKWIEARPFMRPAFDENKERSVGIVTDALRAGLLKEAKRVAKRAAKLAKLAAMSAGGT